MPSGIRGRANPDYSNTEYAQPWVGIDVSLPSSQIQPSACVSLNGAIVRGGLTDSPSFGPVVSSVSATFPTLAAGENVMYNANNGGATYVVTQLAIYSNNGGGTASNKNWTKIFTFPTPYNNQQGIFCSCVIASTLYLSNSQHLGIYAINVNTVTEITTLNSSGPFIGASFMCTIANRLVLGNIIGGDGNQQMGTVTPSTNTHYPDRVAWSFPSAFGSFDPNGAIIQGGFDQISEARGLITGLAVFEAVAFIAHNGGFTEMVPNTNGGNIEPFTFAPLWSADQGVVCRYGSMAQYGSMCCFMGYDQPYQLSPGGLTPVGDQVAFLVQNLNFFPVQFTWANPGLFGSIVEIEGEKHYLCVFSSVDLTGTTPSNNFAHIYDMNMKTSSWSRYIYQNVFISGPIYQSFDNQELLIGGTDVLIRDNWILIPTNPTNWITFGGTLSEVFIGNNLFNHTGSFTYTGSLSALFRAEAPTINIPQTTRKIMVEYENIPSLSATPTVVGITLYGQPLQGGYPNVGQTPTTNTFSIALPYYASGANVPLNAVLTAFSEPIGTANTTLATSLQLTTAQPVKIVRVAIVAETTQADQK